MAFWKTGMRLWPVVLAAVFVGAATGTTTEASGVQSMKTGDLSAQPIGHYDFCKRYRAECEIRSRAKGPLGTDDQLLELIESVNLSVNEAVAPMSDEEIYGVVEYWEYPDEGVGDCEDYVLEKRRQLMDHGISPSHLLITVVRQSNGEGHAVLTVRTDRGDIILDNLTDEVNLWYETDYTFLKRQSDRHSGRWLDLRDGQNLLVGAVR